MTKIIKAGNLSVLLLAAYFLLRLSSFIDLFQELIKTGAIQILLSLLTLMLPAVLAVLLLLDKLGKLKNGKMIIGIILLAFAVLKLGDITEVLTYELHLQSIDGVIAYLYLVIRLVTVFGMMLMIGLSLTSNKPVFAAFKPVFIFAVLACIAVGAWNLTKGVMTAVGYWEHLVLLFGLYCIPAMYGAEKEHTADITEA